MFHSYLFSIIFWPKYERERLYILPPRLSCMTHIIQKNHSIIIIIIVFPGNHLIIWPHVIQLSYVSFHYYYYHYYYIMLLLYLVPPYRVQNRQSPSRQCDYKTRRATAYHHELARTGDCHLGGGWWN